MRASRRLAAVLIVLSVVLSDPGVCLAQRAPGPKKIDTFSDLLQRLGVDSPAQRKYIEDSVKQDLQDEINEHIDLKLDVEVYLKSLNHLVNGEVKEANAYLME